MDEHKSRFSCADFTFPLLSHSKALRLIQLLEIEAVDLGIFEGRSHYYPSEIAKDPVGKGRQLADELKAVGLNAADVFLQTGGSPDIAAANSPDPNVRKTNREVF